MVIKLDSKGVYHAPKEIPKSSIEQMVWKILSEPTISEDDKVKAISEIIIANPDFHRALMQIRKRYEDKLADMEEEMNGVYGDLEDTHRREEKLKIKVKSAETGARVNDIRADAEATLAEVAFQKLYQTMREHNNLLIAAQDSEINRLTSEKANEQLVDAIKETAHRLGVHLVKNDEEIHQLISDWKYKNISEFVQDLLPSKIMTEKETKPPEAPKEAPKEGEK
jgi:hypothetical protein